MSRAFGDLAFQQNEMVTCEPECKSIELDGSEDYFIMGCDGFFEHVSLDGEFLQFVDETIAKEEEGPSVAEGLVNRAKENGSTDNISVIFVKLKQS